MDADVFLQLVGGAALGLIYFVADKGPAACRRYVEERTWAKVHESDRAKRRARQEEDAIEIARRYDRRMTYAEIAKTVVVEDHRLTPERRREIGEEAARIIDRAVGRAISDGTLWPTPATSLQKAQKTPSDPVPINPASTTGSFARDIELLNASTFPCMTPLNPEMCGSQACVDARRCIKKYPPAARQPSGTIAAPSAYAYGPRRAGFIIKDSTP